GSGSTAGGSTAGGSTAGGSTAGGSTAGGSTAGGSTAGGSTAGGSGSTAGGTGSTGTWVNVTPARINLDPDGTAAGMDNNFGVQGVWADPSRPGTLYAPVTYQGLWKSVDYGLTWMKVIASGASPADQGRTALQIAPDGSYLLATSLYPI